MNAMLFDPFYQHQPWLLIFAKQIFLQFGLMADNSLVFIHKKK